jgi:hypothetical protein
LGDIPVGQPGGTVQGRALELESIQPFVVAPLADELIELFPATGPSQLSVTDAAGNYGFPTVPRGAYTAQNGSDQRSGAIDFAGDVDVQSFLFTRTGAVSVVMRTLTGAPVNDFFATLTAFGGDLGAGFVAPSADCTASTAPGDNVAVFSEDSCVSSEDPNLNGVPQGACEVNVYLEGQILPIATFGPEKGCFVNRAGEIVVIACGIGFELALVVPFLMFARRRRAQTRRNRSTGLSDNAASGRNRPSRTGR